MHPEATKYCSYPEDIDRSSIRFFMGEGITDYVKVVFDTVKVISSNVGGIGYKESEQLLSVSFLNGSRYVYIDVDKEDYEGLQQSDSVGRY